MPVLREAPNVVIPLVQNNSRLDTRKGGTEVGIALPVFGATLIFIFVVIFIIGIYHTNCHIRLTQDGKEKRMARLERAAKQQTYGEWWETERPRRLNFFPNQQVCVICLEQIMNDEQVRGLRCLHVFHQICLDEWFGRGHGFCPLCHQCIVQNDKDQVKDTDTLG